MSVAQPPHASGESSTTESTQLRARFRVWRRELARWSRWRDARAVSRVRSALQEKCSYKLCLEVTDAVRLLRLEVERQQPAALPPRQLPCLRAMGLELESGANAARALRVPEQKLVQLRVAAVPAVTALLRSNATVAIVGGGGAGKTTLAEAVYDEIKDQYDACYFMRVGRDADFHHLLIAAWDGMCGRKGARESRDAHNRWNQLVTELRGMSVLLVLDDLWLKDGAGRPVSMLDALNFATPPDMQHADSSRLLVTTRERGALSYQPHVERPVSVGMWYTMPLLDEQNARALFLSHALDGDEQAPMTAEQHALVQQAVAKGAGNPKALQLLGGSVRKHAYDMCKWQEVLSSYSYPVTTSATGVDVDSICRTSYDALRPSLQQCVRSLAFFREDEELHEADLVPLFAAHAPIGGSSARAAARVKLHELVQCSLIDKAVGEVSDFYSVHDVVHDLAKKLAASARQLAVRQVFLCDGAVLAPTQLPKHTVGVDKGSAVGPAVVRAGGNAAEMQPRQSVAVSFVRPRGAISDLSRFRVLRYLRIEGGAITAMPDSIGDCGQLECLDLSGCWALAALPERIGDCHQLAHLKVLLSDALTALPERIGDCALLTRLEVLFCQALAALPERIGDCGHLLRLDLGGCSALVALPEGIGGCSELAHLDLSGCGALLALPDLIGDCHQLTYLDLSYCGALTALPERIGGCSQLAHLDVSDCGGLTELPERISDCRQLVHLDLSGCVALDTIPDSMCACAGLEQGHFDIRGCEMLNVLSEGIERLHPVRGDDPRPQMQELESESDSESCDGSGSSHGRRMTEVLAATIWAATR